MSRDKLISLLKGTTAPVVGISAEAKRAQFFRRLIADKKIGVEQFNSLLNDYIANVKKPKGKFEEMAMRGNLMRELTRPEMSEKVLKRGLDLLKLPHELADQQT